MLARALPPSASVNAPISGATGWPSLVSETLPARGAAKGRYWRVFSAVAMARIIAAVKIRGAIVATPFRRTFDAVDGLSAEGFRGQ